MKVELHLLYFATDIFISKPHFSFVSTSEAQTDSMVNSVWQILLYTTGNTSVAKALLSNPTIKENTRTYIRKTQITA
jgi:hypothetical protein